MLYIVFACSIMLSYYIKRSYQYYHMPIIPLKRILVLLYNLSDEWNIYLNTVHYTWITTGPYVLLIWSSNISQTHALLLLVRWRFTALSRKRVHLIKAWVLWNSVSFWWINSLTISLLVLESPCKVSSLYLLSTVKRNSSQSVISYLKTWS